VLALIGLFWLIGLDWFGVSAPTEIITKETTIKH